MRLRALLLSVLFVAACDRVPTAPTSDLTPTLGADAGLVQRSDSLAKQGYVSWYGGDGWQSVSVSETNFAGEKEVWLSYAGYDASWQLIYAGWGRIPPRDVTGSGLGVLAVTTNTSAEANPEFVRVNDPGGIVHVVWHQVGPMGRLHERDRIDRPPSRIFYNTMSMAREAHVEGTVVGRVVPQATTGYLGLGWAHSMLLLKP